METIKRLTLKSFLTFTVLFFLGCSSASLEDDFNWKTCLSDFEKIHNKNPNLIGEIDEEKFKDYLWEHKDDFQGKRWKDVIESAKNDISSKQQKLIAESEKDYKERRAEYEELKKNFIRKEDEFEGTIWYYHKNWGKDGLAWERKGLYASVRGDGYIYMTSNYYADDWLFHEGVKALIDGKKYSTDKIASFSDNNIRDNTGGKVNEIVQYTSGKDNGLLKAIADNYKETIKVRFIGKDYYDEIPLPYRDKKGIRDAYRLSYLKNEIERLKDIID